MLSKSTFLWLHSSTATNSLRLGWAFRKANFPMGCLSVSPPAVEEAQAAGGGRRRGSSVHRSEGPQYRPSPLQPKTGPCSRKYIHYRPCEKLRGEHGHSPLCRIQTWANFYKKSRTSKSWPLSLLRFFFCCAKALGSVPDWSLSVQMNFIYSLMKVYLSGAETSVEIVGHPLFGVFSGLRLLFWGLVFGWVVFVSGARAADEESSDDDEARGLASTCTLTPPQHHL